MLVVAGAAIAPAYAAVYAMVDEAAPAGTVTEAFAWLATAVAVGAAAGAAIAGAVAESAGPAAALALAGAAGAAALLATAMRARPWSCRPTRDRNTTLGDDRDRHEPRTAAGKVLWHFSMSLDGFLAGPQHEMDWMVGFIGPTGPAGRVHRDHGRGAGRAQRLRQRHR